MLDNVRPNKRTQTTDTTDEAELAKIQPALSRIAHMTGGRISEAQLRAAGVPPKLRTQAVKQAIRREHERQVRLQSQRDRRRWTAQSRFEDRFRAYALARNEPTVDLVWAHLRHDQRCVRVGSDAGVEVQRAVNWGYGDKYPERSCTTTITVRSNWYRTRRRLEEMGFSAEQLALAIDADITDDAVLLRWLRQGRGYGVTMETAVHHRMSRGEWTDRPSADGVRPRPATRTERELSRLEQMGTDELVQLSVSCMHALNRRTKRYPATAGEVYPLKNRYLEAMVRAQRAESIERFSIERQTGYYHECCDREWYTRYEDCDCNGCGCPPDHTEPATSERLWYVIRIDGRGFHQPGPSNPAYDAVATDVEPHDPTNPNTEIPKIGWTIAAQRRCVELAIERSTQLEPLSRSPA